MSLMLSMAAFALAASISPGPVNIVALGSGARHGLRASLKHVTGATLGFSLLLLLIGLGLHELLRHWPALTRVLHAAGVAFLLFMAWKLASDRGELGSTGDAGAPSMLAGATLQWLNPKAWLACVAGVGAYVGEGETALLWQFTAIYFVICYLSIASWAWAGSVISHYLGNPRRVRVFNRVLAGLLVASALYLLVS
ncbi:LysE family translocator [Pseudomonas sp. JQ170]|uniref:LysE family translocator n=1 Tax=unclassified Pseudomonas TaxID=196821 RepID=UPI002656B446|nr:MULTISPECIES: LysE family translocator [unclassified Pseudomonas]MDN7142050.1 LysE family translocator [Pseudomonas sp. JQ170]WRO78343.1 LysE family translocator [Pseudomonas sp. 170C]